MDRQHTMTTRENWVAAAARAIRDVFTNTQHTTRQLEALKAFALKGDPDLQRWETDGGATK